MEQNANPWDDGLGANAQKFLSFQYKAIVFLFITVGWILVWSLKKLQSVLQKS